MASLSYKAGPATAPYRWASVSVRQGRSQGRFFVPLASACEAQVGICLRAAPLALLLPGSAEFGFAGVQVPLLGSWLSVRLPHWLFLQSGGCRT